MAGRNRAPSQRQLRVGEELRHVIAEILARGEIRDPDVEGKSKGYHKKDFDDSGWKAIRIGEFWDKQGYSGLIGSGWYRRAYTFPDFPPGKRVYLHFGAVDETGFLYVDGELVAWHDKDPSFWDKPFALEITGRVQGGTTQQLAIRVHNVARAGGIWKPVSLVVQK